MIAENDKEINLNKYIEHLYDRNIDSNAINCLIKLYMKKGLDLTEIVDTINKEDLKKFTEAVEDGKYDNSLLDCIKAGIIKHVKIDDLISDFYEQDQIISMMTLRHYGVDTTILEDRHFTNLQIEALKPAITGGYAELKRIANPEFSEKKIKILVEACDKRLNLNYFLDGEYSERTFRRIIDALETEVHPDLLPLIKMEDCYDDMQLDVMVGLLGKTYYDFDDEISLGEIEKIKNIFCSENDPIKMIILYDAFYRDDEEYSNIIEQIEDRPGAEMYELLLAKQKLSGDKYEIIEKMHDSRKMHIIRCLLEQKDKDIEEYLKLDTAEEIASEYALKHEKVTIEAMRCDDEREVVNKTDVLDYQGQNAYFLVSDANNEINILEFYRDDTVMVEDIAEGTGCVISSYDELPDYKVNFFDNHDQEIQKIFETFFIMEYDEKNKDFVMYDLVQAKNIQKKLQLNGLSGFNISNLTEYYTKYGDYIDALMDDTRSSLKEDGYDYYEPYITELDELVKYGGPNVENEVIAETFSMQYDRVAIIMDSDGIKENYGKIDEDSISRAKSLVHSLRMEAEDWADGEIYGYNLFDRYGTEIDGCTMFVGKYAMDDILSTAGVEKVIEKIGEFDDIDECLQELEEREEIEDEIDNER